MTPPSVILGAIALPVPQLRAMTLATGAVGFRFPNGFSIRGESCRAMLVLRSLGPVPESSPCCPLPPSETRDQSLCSGRVQARTPDCEGGWVRKARSVREQRRQCGSYWIADPP